ncbi:MAG TPA: response regulator [Syntrophorhabdaceae bacterium]|nr:response regulator [Syntrophorhabdaceae bacterium]HOL05808.1 response regulator [Syntrophorhabdaceae bacterium]HON86362.1 response regulator [Syntrophorhabdaceae bacterium]HOT42864.1 response regulator [Syntrophorhabdaceae bacterium]HPC66456.1 response regulator [Syntrophorhabdaceae bacterium]
MSRKTRILLVDNDVDFIDLNKAVLENNGFEVAVAYAGREVMDKVKFEQPDIIVLDLMMEKHDTGFAVARALKADPVYKNIPILMLTAVGSETGMDFSQELDGYWMKTDDYANKPLSPEELIKRINALLERNKKA